MQACVRTRLRAPPWYPVGSDNTGFPSQHLRSRRFTSLSKHYAQGTLIESALIDDQPRIDVLAPPSSRFPRSTDLSRSKDAIVARNGPGVIIYTNEYKVFTYRHAWSPYTVGHKRDIYSAVALHIGPDGAPLYLHPASNEYAKRSRTVSQLPLRPKFVSIRNEPENFNTWDVQSASPWTGKDSPPTTTELASPAMPESTALSRRSQNAKTSSVTSLNGLWNVRIQQLATGKDMRLYRVSEDTLRRATSKLAIGSVPGRQLETTWSTYKPPLECTKLQLWEDLMLFLMQVAPEKALRFLEVSTRCTSLQVSRSVLADCLTFFVHHDYSPEPLYITQRNYNKTLQRLTHQLLQSLEPDAKANFEFPDSLAHFLLRFTVSIEPIQTLLNSSVTLHANTILRLLEKSIEWETLHLSLQLLRVLVDSRYDLADTRVQRACTKLFENCLAPKNAGQVSRNIIRPLLEMGIRPGIKLLNKFLVSTIEADELQLAMKLYQIAREHGIKPELSTYAILLDGAKASRDPGCILSILEDALGSPKDMPHTVGFLQVMMEANWTRHKLLGNKTFDAIFEMYRRYFHLAPLVELQMCNDDLRSKQANAPNLEWPSPRILSLMIACFVADRRPQNLADFYDCYHSMVVRKHPLIAPISGTGAFVENSFIMSFAQSGGPEKLAHCVLVVKHMLEASAHHASKKVSGEPIPKDAPLPDPNATPEHISDPVQDGLTSGADVEEVVNDTPGTAEKPMASKQQDKDLEYVSLESCYTPTHSELLAAPPFTPTKPTVATWTRLMEAYTHHGQIAGAEKTLTIMQEQHHLQPTRHTWHVLINAYVTQQDVSGTIDAVTRMQDQGHHVTSETIKIIGQIRNRGYLARLLKKLAPRSMELSELLDDEQKQETRGLGRPSNKKQKMEERLRAIEEAARAAQATQGFEVFDVGNVEPSSAP